MTAPNHQPPFPPDPPSAPAPHGTAPVPAPIGTNHPGRLADLEAKVARAVRRSRADATLKAYRADWIDFTTWCAGIGLDPLPATPATVAAYVAELADPPDDRPPRKVSTITQRLAAIGEGHKVAGHHNPAADPLVRETMKGIRRHLGVAPTQKRGIATADIRTAIADLGNRLIDHRDRLLLLFGFAGGFRRSEARRRVGRMTTRSRRSRPCMPPGPECERQGSGRSQMPLARVASVLGGVWSIPVEALYVDPTIPRYTRAQLVAEMDQRFGLTDGAFRKWQEKGLVAAPDDGRWAKGRPRLRAGSVVGQRPPDAHRRPRTPRTAPPRRRRWPTHFGEPRKLRGVVVGVLGRLSDARPGSPRAALLGDTPAWRTGKGPQQRSDRPPRPPTRRAGRRPRRSPPAAQAGGCQLADRLWHGDLAGLRALVGDVATVMDPDDVGRRIGAPGVSIDAASVIDRLYLTHLGAQAVVTGRPALGDDDWQAARTLLRRSWVGYQAAQPWLADKANKPDLFVEPTIDYQMTGSSSGLLLVLGDSVANRYHGGATG